MESRTVHVPNISCGHCTQTIENEVGELAGVASVEADAQTKQVTIRFAPPTTWPEIEALLSEIGYAPAS